MQAAPFLPAGPYLQGDKVKCTCLPWSSYSHRPPHPPVPKGRWPTLCEGGLGDRLSRPEGHFPQQSYRISRIWNAVK